MTKYGYYRVATYTKEVGELKRALKKEMCDEIWADQCSGAVQPPMLTKLLTQLKEGDMLVVASLERLTRDSLALARIVGELFNKGVKVHILNMGLLENNFMSDLFLYKNASFAELESESVSRRIIRTKEIARQRKEYIEGRLKTYTPEQLYDLMKLLETKTFDEVAAEIKY